MRKIESLTAEQAALLPIWHERWLQIGMDERPVDRELARDAIRRAYADISRPEPLIVFCDSPATSSLGVALWPDLFKNGSQIPNASLGTSLGESMEEPLRASLRASLGDSLDDSLRACLGASLEDALRDSLAPSLGVAVAMSLRDCLGAAEMSLRASLRESLGASFGVALKASLWVSLGDSLGMSLRDSLASLGASLDVSLPASYFWGQHDAFWSAFYLFCEEIGVEYQIDARARLQIMADLAQSCGWLYFYENVCFVSGRPKVKTEIVDDANGQKVHRLHSADGPAMSFADGFSIWAWHGTRVPRRVIEEPSALTPAEILTEQNAEIRRAMIERFGIANLLKQSNARVLDTAVQKMRAGEEPKLNELLVLDLPGDPDGRLVALRVIDPSTSHEYVLRVPPDQKTVIGALAWTFNMKPEEYVLEAET